MKKTEKNRHLLVNIGEKMREIDPCVWINCVIKEIKKSPKTIWIVDDVRHINAYEGLKQNGFRFIRMNVDEHIRQSRILNLYQNNASEHHKYDNHITENELNNIVVDATFTISQHAHQHQRLESQVHEYISTMDFYHERLD